MYGVAVKCLGIIQNTDCEGSLQTISDVEARKRGGNRIGALPVVHAVNDDNSLSAIHSRRLSETISYPPEGVRSQE